MGSVMRMSSLFNTPSVATKQLAFNIVNGRRKVRLSTNFLALMDFQADMPLVAQPVGEGKGFFVQPSSGTDPSHKVYSRGYNRSGRSNNPLELVMEFGGQQFIDSCFPKHIERFHVEMRPGQVMFSPIPNRVFNIINKLKRSTSLSVMTALTGGVDVYAMEKLGWKADVILEYRPPEARDLKSKRNLSEVHALNTWYNGNPKIILNENIHDVDLYRLSALLQDAPPIIMCHYSLGCDDASNAKSNTAKKKSVQDLSTMIDMVYPALKQIEAVEPAIVLIENVEGFRDSAAGVLMTTTLRRFGYHVTEMVLNGLDFGAKQARKRYYMVASCFPGFEPPAPVQTAQGLLWPVIEKHLPKCHDVTDTSLIQSREGHSRNMPPYLTSQSVSCPTILKSQDRIRDGVFIQEQDRIYRPTVELLQELMSIPESFDVSWMAKEQATETLGQSIDFVLHQAVITAINNHLITNLGKRAIVQFGLSQ